MTPISERIALIIKALCDNNNSIFARAVETSEANVRNYLNGTQPKFDFLAKIIGVFEINCEWLLTGKGSMLDHVNPEIMTKFALQTDHTIINQSIPLYDLAATAGLMSLFFDKSNQIPLDYISIPNIPKCDGAVYVTGDSMYPLLKAGDIVLYKQVIDIENNLFWGEMYLISFDMDGDEYVAVKFIQKSDDPDKIKLVSQNQHHSPFDLHKSRIKAMALIKASIRINSIK